MTLAAVALALAASTGDVSCAIGNAVPSEAIHTTQASDAADRLRRGRIPEAKAILLDRIADPSSADAETASLLALAYAAEGDSRATAQWAQRALAPRAASPRVAAIAALNAGFALAETGNGAAARAALESAQRAAAQAADPVIAAAAAVNLALLESRIGGNAHEAAVRAYPLAREVADPSRRASFLVAIGLALVPEQRKVAGAPERLASEVLNDAYRAAVEARDARLMAHALGLAGELQLRTGNVEVARDALVRANTLARVAADDPWRFRWLWLLGVAQRELGDAAALATLEQAVAVLEAEKARRSFAVFASLTLSRDYGRVYRDLTDLLLVEGGTNLARAREVLELSHTAEIEDFFRDPCIARRPPASAKGLPTGVAVVYPIVFTDRIEIIVAHGAEFRRFSSRHGSTEVSREVRRLRTALEPPGMSGYVAPARRLHEWLVQPVERFLEEKGVKTLVWIPDGSLRGLPFAALHDGRAHLVEKYALAVTPLAAFSDGVPASARMRAVVTGLSLSRQGFPALPAVSQELDELSGVLAAPVLRDESFTAVALRSTLEKTPANVIHIASHGQFAPEPGGTFLLTYDGRITLAQLRTALTAGQLREEPIDLLTLSACQTAAGDDRSSLGLAGVAIGAGARSVLATLWSVGDESTARLVTGFYKHLLVPGTSKATALRQSQVELMKDARFSHPAYWSPYLLIGNWN